MRYLRPPDKIKQFIRHKVISCAAKPSASLEEYKDKKLTFWSLIDTATQKEVLAQNTLLPQELPLFFGQNTSTEYFLFTTERLIISNRAEALFYPEILKIGLDKDCMITNVKMMAVEPAFRTVYIQLKMKKSLSIEVLPSSTQCFIFLCKQAIFVGRKYLQ